MGIIAIRGPCVVFFSLSLSLRSFFVRKQIAKNFHKCFYLVISYWPRNERYILHGTCFFCTCVTYVCFPATSSKFFLVYLLVRFRVCININTGMQDKSYFESSLTENLLKKGARVDFYLTINRLIKLVWSNLSRVIFLLSSHGKR